MPSKMRHGLLISLVVISLIVISLNTSYAETVNYIYDELNRLIWVEYEDGTVILYIYDKAGNRLEMAIPFPDTTPPTTTADPLGGSYNTTKIVTLSCNDGYGAGCDKIYYTTDGTTPTTSSPVYSSPINISVTTTLKFFAKDLIGNTEAVKTQTYTIDTNLPTTTASPGGGFYSTAQAVALTCDDGTGSGCDKIYYTTDGTIPTTSSPVYSSPINISVTATLKFFAKDLAGNSEAVKSETYYIGPESVSTPSNPNGPVNGNVGTSYTYSTGGAASNYGHSLEYLFDWGDGTNSGWLPVGQTSASHSWGLQGNYLIKAQARCSIHPSVVSSWSGDTSVSIVLPAGNDSYTKSLLHMNGPDGSTTFTDDAAGGTHTWTRYGDAQIDTAQSKFGGASGLFDGTGDYIDTPDSPDHEPGSGNFTIDFWVRFNSLPGSGITANFFSRRTGTVVNDLFAFFFRNTSPSILGFASYVNTVIKADYKVNWSPSVSAWYHLCVVRNATSVYFFIDGVSQTLTETVAIGTNDLTFSQTGEALTIGRNGNSDSNYLNGWIDEFRFSKGIARWTSNFEVPDAQYGP